MSEGKLITKLRIKRGRLDVSPEYLAEFIAVGQRVAACEGVVSGPARITRRVKSTVAFNSLRGSTLAVRRELMRRFRSISWSAVEAELRPAVYWCLGRR